jgi:hypothetical protein
VEDAEIEEAETAGPLTLAIDVQGDETQEQPTAAAVASSPSV